MCDRLKKSERERGFMSDLETILNAIKLLPEITSETLRTALIQRLTWELVGNGNIPLKVYKPLRLAVVARSLGYELAPGQAAKLGCYVAERHNALSKTQHGRREVNNYLCTDELEETICEFFINQ